MYRGGGGAYGTAAITGGSITGQTGTAYILAQSYAAVDTPADVTEDTLATITVPANALGANGQLRIHLHITCTNNANAKTIRVRYSGGAGTQFYQGSYASIAYGGAVLGIGNRNATNSQTGATFGVAGVANGNPGATAAVDTTASTTLVITGQKGLAGDTLTLAGYTVEIVKP